MAEHNPYAALRYHSYRLFLIGGMFSNIGAQMQSVAVGWELYERTHSAMALGWVGFVQFLPIILFSLPAGQLADRFDRRRIAIVAQLLMAAASFGLAVLSLKEGDVRWMYLCLFLGGVARSVSMPARSSLMPLLVPKELFSNAVTWLSSSYQLASTMGPALGGIVLAICQRPSIVYITDSILSLTYVGCLMGMRVNTAERRDNAATLRNLLAGVRFVWNSKLILAAITLDMFAVLLGGAVSLLPVYAKDILHVGPSGLGCMRAAPAVGALIMGLTIAHRPPMRRAGRTLVFAVIGFGVATIIFGLSRSYWLSLVMLCATGAVDNISVVIRHTLVQMGTPDELRGRVSSVNGLFISCSNELGEFESGLTAAWFGPVKAVVAGGVGTILVVLGVARLWPQLAKLGPLIEAATPVTEEEEMERPSS